MLTERLRSLLRPPRDAQDTYWLTTDPETLDHLTGPYATRAFAVKDAQKALDLKPGDTFWTGRAETSAIRHVLKLEGFADTLFDYLKGELENLTEEEPEGWLEDVTVEQKLDLEDALAKTLLRWLVENRHYPPFFMYEDESDHTVPGTSPKTMQESPEATTKPTD